MLSDLIDVVSAGKSAERTVSIFRAWNEFLRCRDSYPSWKNMDENIGEAVIFFEDSGHKISDAADRRIVHVESSPLIVVLDEASSLLETTLLDAENRQVSLLRLLRRALNILNHMGRRIMFILTDTNFRVSEFSPPSLL